MNFVSEVIISEPLKYLFLVQTTLCISPRPIFCKEQLSKDVIAITSLVRKLHLYPPPQLYHHLLRSEKRGEMGPSSFALKRGQIWPSSLGRVHQVIFRLKIVHLHFHLSVHMASLIWKSLPLAKPCSLVRRFMLLLHHEISLSIPILTVFTHL